MEAILDLQTREMELFEKIEGLGGLIFATRRAMFKGNIEVKGGQNDLDQLHTLQQDAVRDLTEEFGVIMPTEGGPPRYSENDYADAEKPPEGKKWYWPWYHAMRQKYYQAQYDKMICSACPFSSGRVEQLATSIPCDLIHGSIYNLFPTDAHCGMIPFGDREPKQGDFSREQFLGKIRDKVGEEGVTKFLEKEQELLTLYKG